MKITLNTHSLLNQLQAVIGAVQANSTLAVLTHVLIEAKAGKLTLTGTDLTLQLIATKPAQIERPGTITASAKKLLDICKNLPSQSDITLEVKDSKLEVKSGRSRFSVAAVPADEFPNIGESQTPIEIQISQAQLHRLLKKTAHAMATKDVRYYLNGVCLDLSNSELRAVATDGHRMAMASARVTATDENQSCILPLRAATTLQGLLTQSDTEITLRFGKAHIHAELPLGEDGTLGFISSLVDGKFPDYNRVIPRSNNNKLILHREDMALALTRTSLMTGKHGGILLAITPNYLTLKARNENQEEATEGVDVEYTGKDLEIGFSATYLLDALKVVTAAQAVIELGEAGSSAKITDPNDESVVLIVMPMKI